MNIIRTTARILVGSLLLCVGIASALGFARTGLSLNASAAEVSGEIFAVVILTVVPAVVGFKMLTRRNLPAKSG